MARCLSHWLPVGWSAELLLTDWHFGCSLTLDTREITVYEQTKENDGRQGGKFLERKKARSANNPNAMQHCQSKC